MLRRFPRHRTYIAPLLVVMFLLTGLGTPKPALQMPLAANEVCEIGTPFRDEPLFPSGLNIDSRLAYAETNLATGDFNGDNRIDLIGSSSADANVAILINQTADKAIQPSFSLPILIPAGGAGYTIRVGELNNDGRSDIIVFYLEDTTQQIYALLSKNQQNGEILNFTPPIAIDVGVDIQSVEISDINADGKNDIIVGSFDSVPLRVFLNNTSVGSTLLNLFEHAIEQEPIDKIVIAHINDDELPDIVIETFGNIVILINTTEPESSVPSFLKSYDDWPGIFDFSPRIITTGDINRDHRTDIIIEGNDNDLMGLRYILVNETEPHSDTIHFNQIVYSDYSFRYSDGLWVADFDGNDALDIASSSISYITISQNQTTDPNEPAFRLLLFLTHAYATYPMIADLNADGLSDIMAIDLYSGNVHIKLNATPADSDEIDFGLAAGLPVENVVGFATADLNRDGREDVITTGGKMQIRMNYAGSSENILRTKLDIPTAHYISSIATGDMNGDGTIDLAASHEMSQTFGIYLNNTPVGARLPVLADEQIFPVNSLIRRVWLADMNADQRLDLIFPAFNGLLFIVLNHTPIGSTELQFGLPQQFNTQGTDQEIVITDLNNYTRLDLALANNTFPGSGLAILLNTTTPDSNSIEFAPLVIIPVQRSAGKVSAADLNGDGRPDLVVSNQGWPDSNTMLINTTPSEALVPSFQTGKVYLEPDYSDRLSANAIRVAQLNNDNKPDLLVFGEGLYLLQNEIPDGTLPSLFITKKPIRSPDVTPGDARGKIVDLNNDGRVDIIWPALNTIYVLLNRQEPAIATIAGTPQHTQNNTQFALSLEVIVKDTCGNPVEGAKVRFMAPLGGASATLSSDVVTTDANGRASVLATANDIAGSYSVNAAIDGTVISTQFALTNDPSQPQETATPEITPGPTQTVPTQTPPTETPTHQSRIYIPGIIVP